MRHEIVVFLGPSLPQPDALKILEADYRAPAKRGDIPVAVRDGARVICLIDGVFFQDCSVGHREVLAAIAQGVRVIGASSMGALRASELDTLGMEGIGEVYRLYKSGEVVSDDEVALVFDPDSGIALSVPLVNIRYVLGLARENGIVSGGECKVLFEIARSLYFPERSWERVTEIARGSISGEVLERFGVFVEKSPDLKREDAVCALVRAREIAKEMGI